jgi:hypothetical protein
MATESSTAALEVAAMQRGAGRWNYACLLSSGLRRVTYKVWI